MRGKEEKKKRELLLCALAAPWAVALIAGLIAGMAIHGKSRAMEMEGKAEVAKNEAYRELAGYIEQREQFRRNCEETIEQGNRRLREATEKEGRAELALLNSEALLREFGYSSADIEAFHSSATDEKRISSLIAEKAHRHLPGEIRPSNGNVILDVVLSPDSSASLTMINGLHEDAYVKLIRGNRCVASFYVRGDDRFTLTGIADGQYVVMYCLGFGWDQTEKDFKRGRSAVRYDDTLTYLTRAVDTPTSRTTYFNEVSLTLHKTAFGNATTSEIDPTQFDRY